MTQNEERETIFKTLEAYKKKYKADYYCIILTPTDDKKVTIQGNIFKNSRNGDEAGRIISDLVEQELFRKPLKRK